MYVVLNLELVKYLAKASWGDLFPFCDDIADAKLFLTLGKAMSACQPNEIVCSRSTGEALTDSDELDRQRALQRKQENGNG